MAKGADMKRLALAAITAMLVTFLIAPAAIARNKPKPPKSVRLYVFDCGLLTKSAVSRAKVEAFVKQTGARVVDRARSRHLQPVEEGTGILRVVTEDVASGAGDSSDSVSRSPGAAAGAGPARGASVFRPG